MRKNEKTDKTTKPSKPTDKDYHEIGKAVAHFYESGYLSRRTTVWMSFLKGIAGGFGGVIGATIVIALLLWFLSFFEQYPFINKIIDTLDSQDQYQSQSE